MMESDSPSKAFLGVRFVLFGFDPVNANKVRSKLLNGGGVDVGQYSQNCTHVIVDKLVYDDPVCVAARSDNKTLVTALWVDHSFDAGMPMDPTSIMYRPLKDLDGIPGAKRLIICLTGYQRQDRDDIMIMVGLMGAQFSKPLVANKVTHLICYKFEGEKYELAKMLKTIKLVNHCWLEDCLKDWKLLPEANHKRSGYELEMMEAQAKDSEEEAEETTVKHFAGRNVNNSPHNLRIGVPTTCELPKSVGELSTSPKGPVNVDNRTDILLIPGKENTSGQPSSFGSVDVPKLIGCQDTIVSRGATSGELPDPLDRTPDSKKVGNDLTSTSSAERPPHSDPKFSDISSSRKTLRRSSLSMCSGEISGKISDCSPSGGLKFNDDFDKYSFKVEQGKDRFSSGCFQTSLKGTDLVCEEDSSGLLPQKRTVDISYAGLKLQKVSPDAKLCIASPAAGDKAPRLEPTILIDGLRETNIHLQLDNHGLPGDKAPNMNAAQKSGANISTTKFSTFSKKSLTPDVSFNSETVTMETEQDGNVDAETPQTYFQSLRKSVSSSKPDIVDSCMGKPANLVGETGEPQNLQQDVECSLSNKKLEPEKSEGPANLNLIEEGNDSSVAKPRRKKTVAKKSLGARPKLSTFNNQKGPIYPNKFTPQSDAVIHSIGVKETANHENSISFIKADISPPTVNVETANHENSSSFINVNVMKSNNDAENKDESACDETEAPEDKLEDELESPLNEEKSGMVSLTDKADTIIGEKSEMVQHIKNNCNTSMHDDATASEEGPNRVEPERAVWDKSSLVEPTLNGNGVKGKKCPAGRTKVKTDVTKSKKVADGEETQIENNEGTGMEKEKRVLLPSGKTKSCPVPANKSANSIEVEKENKPVIDGVQNISQGKDCVGKSVVKSNVMPRTSNQKARKVSTDSSTSAREIPNGVKTEPAWFILSGHRLQRKEFQQVIRRLKGRLCRDSHQWSYQATHFIAPDPIRRTEKFFSAAASGRWILKTDYLTACSQAGKFLEEEPYEWHQNGLSEDGAINMEAPRKWRLLRKRTGHGALYGMRIVIYGECIAPPLDTLKRVVKAGDGTILATSPPYNRFLNSGVDFAIISPGMPRVDMWVQEFLKHEIPCVLADLLVEYVCKPGYPLEKHVLYSTNAWAEKSIACLQSRAEETAEDSTVSTPVTPPDHGSNDVACQVCGSRDRGEVMLICGNESGSIGCGVGTHIDCCDPPLEDIPEYDWFCHNCSRSRNTTTSPKKKRKGDSLLKSK